MLLSADVRACMLGLRMLFSDKERVQAVSIADPRGVNGDGKFDAAIFRPSTATWYLNRSTSGTLIQQFGAAGDIPVPNAYVR